METHTFYGLGYAFEVNAIKTVCGLRRTPSIFLSGIFLGVIMKHRLQFFLLLKVDSTGFDIRSNEAMTIVTPNASSLSTRPP
jgi:hypothetical protein